MAQMLPSIAETISNIETQSISEESDLTSCSSNITSEEVPLTETTKNPSPKKRGPKVKFPRKKRERKTFPLSDNQKVFIRQRFKRLGYRENQCYYCLHVIENDHVSR